MHMHMHMLVLEFVASCQAGPRNRNLQDGPAGAPHGHGDAKRTGSAVLAPQLTHLICSAATPIAARTRPCRRGPAHELHHSLAALPWLEGRSSSRRDGLRSARCPCSPAHHRAAPAASPAAAAHAGARLLNADAHAFGPPAAARPRPRRPRLGGSESGEKWCDGSAADGGE